MKKILIINIFVLLIINIFFNNIKNKELELNSKCRKNFYKHNKIVKETENEYFLSSYNKLKAKNVKLYYYDIKNKKFLEVRTSEEIGKVLLDIVEKNREERIRNINDKDNIIKGTFFSDNKEDEYFIKISEEDKRRIFFNKNKYYHIKNRCSLIEILLNLR